jgi:hypothetical protein
MAPGGCRAALRSTEGQVHVEAASPEARFGVRSGDRILRVDDTAVRRVEHLAEALRHSIAHRLPVAAPRQARTDGGGRRCLAPGIEVPPPPPPPPPRRALSMAALHGHRFGYA